MRSVHALAGILGIVLLAFGFWGVRAPAPQPETTDALSAIAKAEEIADPIQRCLAFPAPRGLDWPKAYVEAFCMDTLSPGLSEREISDEIEDGKAAGLDARLDGILDGYFAHRVPEGVVYQAWNRFRSSSATVERLVDHWLDQAPKSANAFAARGIAAVERASESRGEDTIENTPGRDLEKMRTALEAAERDLEQALSANPRLMPAYVALLRAARLGGDDALAKRTLDRALAADPAGYFARGEYITGLEPRWGGSFEAMDRFAAAAAPQLAVNPRLAALKLDALAARGLPFYWKHDYRTALQHFERGLAVAPDAFYLDVGQFAAGETGDNVRAVELISQYLRFMPYDAKKHVSRALYLERLKRDDWAEADYAAVLRIDPSDRRAAQGYVNLLVKRGDPAAETKLRELTAADPANTWAVETLAWLYVHRSHRYPEAIALMDGLIARKPDSGELWLYKLQLLDAMPATDMRSTVEQFVRYADPSSKEQRDMLPVAQKWLASHPAPAQAH